MSQADIMVNVDVISARDLLGSDHDPLKAQLVGRSFLAREAPMTGKACWSRRDCWAEAVNSACASLMFIAGWAAAVVRSDHVRQWVGNGTRKGLR